MHVLLMHKYFSIFNKVMYTYKLYFINRVLIFSVTHIVNVNFETKITLASATF